MVAWGGRFVVAIRHIVTRDESPSSCAQCQERKSARSERGHGLGKVDADLGIYGSDPNPSGQVKLQQTSSLYGLTNAMRLSQTNFKARVR